MISDGSFLSECSVEHSIVGIRSRLEPGVELKVEYNHISGKDMKDAVCTVPNHRKLFRNL
jgi:hypothetical protein